MNLPSARGVALATVAMAAALSAQEALGARTGSPFDLSTTIKAALGTTSAGSWGDKCLGAARDRNGNYWVAVGPPGLATTGRGKLCKLDASGSFLKAVDQPLATATSFFGLRDLAYDGSQTILAGCESALTGDTLFAFDLVTESFTVAGNWKGPTGIAVHRGLAYDAGGQGGLGSLFVSDFGPGPIVEFDKQGSVLRTIAKPAGSDGTFGLAIDPGRRRLWLFSQTGSTYSAVRVVGIEVDLVTGLATGTMFLADSNLGGSPIAGGCEWYAEGQNGAKPTLVLVHQGLTGKWLDRVAAQFDFGKSCGGRIGMAGDAPYQGNSAWAITLDGSPIGTVGTLCMTIQPGLNRVPIWPFVPGCEILMSLFEVPYAFPGVVLNAGSGRQSLPVPFGIVGDPTFQWVEIAPTQNPPLRLSNGARTSVGYP